ncbi:MAG: hypothetical protein U0Q21_09090 [Dermatophilaceae bacterium]
MHHSTKRAVLTGLTTAAALTTLTLGATGASGSTHGAKPVPKPTAVDRSILAKEAGARVSTPANARAAQATIQPRIAAYVAKHGTTYSFGSYIDAKTGEFVLQTDAPASVVARLTDLRTTRAAAGAHVRTTHAAVSDHYNRRDDTPPFYGGGGIWSSGSGTCSSGYTVTYGGYKYMITAGHCFPDGATVLTESGAQNYGIVWGRRLPTLGSGPRDMEIVYTRSYAARIFTGGVTSSSSAQVVGAGDAVQGYTNYCHSGRTTGENCGHTATDVNAQVCTQTGCKSPVVAFTGGVLSQPGDSGSPFYVKNTSNQAWIRGHVIAGGSGVSWAEKWSKVVAAYGVSIATS